MLATLLDHVVTDLQQNEGAVQATCASHYIVLKSQPSCRESVGTHDGQAM